jgi:hypothetical protein
MGQATPQVYNRDLGKEYGQASDIYNTQSNVSNVGGSDTPMANQIMAEMKNFMGGAGGISDYLKSMYGKGPSLAQQQLTSNTGQAIQQRGEETVGNLRENPYTSGARAGADMLGKYLAPMETGLYTQQAQDAQNRSALGLQAAQQQMNIPSMYNQMLAPEQFKTQNQFNYDQLNTNIDMQNILNQLSRAGGLSGLSQLKSGSQEVYMQPDFWSQILQSLMGGIGQGAGKAASTALGGGA